MPPRRRGRCWVLGAALAAVGAMVPAVASASTAAASVHVDTLNAFSAALHKLVAMSGGPPGATAIVQVGTAVHVVVAGEGDVASAQAPTADDTVRIASVSKAFNGAVTLALVGKHELSLADSVGTVLPTLPHAWSAVTVTQLLQHTSGVPDYIKDPVFLKQLQADPLQSLTPTQLLGFVAKDPLLFAPGSRYHYSDSDNIILGLMDEAVTGGTYEAALSTFVTGPLSLTHTVLPPNANLATPYLHGYDVSGTAAPEDVSLFLNPGLAWASGGMLSTPRELNTFMRAYASGTLITVAAHARQLTFVPGESGPPGPGINSSGLGIYRYATHCGTVYGHTGNFPGYTIFAASTLRGTRSVDVIVNTQLQATPARPPYVALRAAEGLGVCAALHS
jgi:D-alanyl-D-alanine carboxypeptidase